MAHEFVALLFFPRSLNGPGVSYVEGGSDDWEM